LKKVRENGWYIWSSHGSILFYIAANPGSTIQEIADGLCLTTRTIWGVVGDLRRAGMLDVEKDGRKHRYHVNLDAQFRHPTIHGVTLRALLGELPATARRRERAAARR
jgi:DNA-binding MarR family transcriptional regulator